MTAITFEALKKRLAERLAEAQPGLRTMDAFKARLLTERFALDYLALHGLRGAFTLLRLDAKERDDLLARSGIDAERTILPGMFDFYGKLIARRGEPERIDVLDLAVDA